jgi:flagellar biosynthesis component FlhA
MAKSYDDMYEDGEDLYGQYDSYLGPNNSPPPEGKPGSTGNAVDSAGNMALMSGNPYVMGAGLGLKAIGTGLEVYGAYKDNEREDDRLAEAKKEMQRQRAMEEEDRKRKQQMEDTAAAFGYGNYSMKNEDRRMKLYQDYYRNQGY